jgi:hypothetical protein
VTRFAPAQFPPIQAARSRSPAKNRQRRRTKRAHFAKAILARSGVAKAKAEFERAQKFEEAIPLYALDQLHLAAQPGLRRNSQGHGKPLALEEVKEHDRSTGANVNKANLGVENFDPIPRMRVKRTDFNILHSQNLHRPLTTLCQETSRVGRNKMCRTCFQVVRIFG